MKISNKTVLFAIIILAAILRLFNLNWDQGFHMHPDERAILLSVVQMKLPTTISQFLTPQSSWNPHFFAYGSLPFYILRIAGDIAGFLLHPSFAAYDRINLIGRILSALFDIGTIVLIFLLGRKLFSETIGLLSSFFYTISVLAIQLSHFYAVDTLLTFLLTATLLILVHFYEKPTVAKAILIGIFFAASLATKVSATVLLSAIGISLTVDFALVFLKQPHKIHHWYPHLPSFVKHLIGYGCIIAVTTVIGFAFFEPYAFIDRQSFWQQTLEQSRMTKSAFTFPYTLQYIGKTPYLYELKNIFFFGLGPILATLSFIGAIYFTYLAIKKEGENRWAQETIIATFFFTYFIVVGSFAIGFMRYLLPLYPLLCLFAAVLVYKLYTRIHSYKNRFAFFIFYILFSILLMVWPASFMRIYTKPNTRVTASYWIYNAIPPNSILGVEHWDDQLPIGGTTQYKIETLALYDQDTPEKWQKINEQLARTDYLIIASNRLYTPLQKLTDCRVLPIDRCYTKTANYYKDLFSGRLGYKKVAEFTSYPTLEIRNWKLEIQDVGADESFTVYDHPKVIIFKKQPL